MPTACFFNSVSVIFCNSDANESDAIQFSKSLSSSFGFETPNTVLRLFPLIQILRPGYCFTASANNAIAFSRSSQLST